MPLIAAKAGLHWIGLGGAGEAIQEVYKEGKDFYDSASEEITAKVKEQIEKKIENFVYNITRTIMYYMSTFTFVTFVYHIITSLEIFYFFR